MKEEVRIFWIDLFCGAGGTTTGIRQSKANAEVVGNQIIKDDDPEIIVKIKQFMIDNKIVDITIRMLQVKELKLIQGFPDWFKLVGTKTNQLKFIGNSVVPLMAQRLVECNYDSLVNHFKIAA